LFLIFGVAHKKALTDSPNEKCVKKQIKITGREKSFDLHFGENLINDDRKFTEN